MKKFVLFLFVMNLLFAQNVFVPKNGIYINSGKVQDYYSIENCYLETKSLIKLVKNMLNNKKFVNLSYLEETGNVKANTAVLLKQLLKFLEGEKAYSNTAFDNNTDSAGIKGILKDSLNSKLFDIPQSAKENILDSVKSSQFFILADKTEKLLNSVNKNSISDIVKNFNLLFDQYVNNIQKLNIKLISSYNQQIKNRLLRDYRIEAKTGLIKILNIFKKIFNENKKVYISDYSLKENN